MTRPRGAPLAFRAAYPEEWASAVLTQGGSTSQSQELPEQKRPDMGRRRRSSSTSDQGFSECQYPLGEAPKSSVRAAYET